MKDFKDVKILVAGEICTDEYIYGTSTRVSPENPKIPVVRINKIEKKEGMTSNVYNNLQSMGATTTLIHNSEGPGIIKSRIFSNGNQLVRLDNDSFQKRKSDLDILTELKETLQKNDGLLVQDYGKGFWTPTTLEIIRSTNKPVFVDPYPTTPLELYKGCTLLTPNKFEAEKLTGKITVKECLQELIRVTNCKYAIITLGADGMALMENGNQGVYQFKPEPVKVVDVCGAGDSVIATISLLYLGGYSIESCIHVANNVAGQTIQRIGVVSVSRESLEKAISDHKKNSL